MSPATPRSLMVRLGRGAVRRVAHHLAGSVQVKRLARQVLDRMPALQTRVYAWVYRPEQRPPRRPRVPFDHTDLSPHAEAAYRELKQRLLARKR